MKSTLLFTTVILSLLFCSCTPGLKLHTAPDKALAEDSIMLKGFLEKDHDLNFSILQNKSQRRKYLRQINSLAKEGLTLFKTGKMPSDNYVEFATAATTFGDVLWLLANAENATPSAAVIGLDRIKTMSGQMMDKVKNNSAGQQALKDAKPAGTDFDLACTLVIIALNGYLEQFRH